MEHREVLARLGDAALERDGIRRLIASDPGLAAHVDACRTCAAERDAWLRATDALAEALAPGQSPEEAAGSPVALPAGLRERTLRVAAARGIARPVTHPRLGEQHVVASPLTLSGVDKTIRAAAPDIAADTDAVLAEAGYSAAEIAALREHGVI